MRVKTLLVFALLIQLGALAQTQAGSCGTYPRDAWVLDHYASTWVFPWFAAEGDPSVTDIGTSPGWKSWITISNLSKKPVSLRLEFYKPEGGDKLQSVWRSVREWNIVGVTSTVFEISPNETVEVRLLAKAADMFASATGLAVGSIRAVFLSPDPCVLDVQGKMSLMFLEIADGVDGKKKVTRLGSIDPVKVSSATNRVFINVTGTPFWARAGNPAVEIPSFALTNLDPLPQDIKVSLLGPDGNPVVAPKFITLAGGAVTATEVETLFGVEAFNSTGKVFAGRLVFEGTGHLSAIALQFVGDSAMGSKKVFTF